MNEQDSFGTNFGLNPDVKIVTLTDAEIELLKMQPTESQSDGGWQSLLVTLQGVLDERTKQIFLPPHLLSRIQKYAFGYGGGGWEDRLVTIFARTLGPRLDGKR